LGSLTIALLPFWIWLTLYKLIDPEDFWQKAVTIGFGAYFLGGLQILLLLGWVAIAFAIWED